MIYHVHVYQLCVNKVFMLSIMKELIKVTFLTFHEDHPSCIRYLFLSSSMFTPRFDLYKNKTSVTGLNDVCYKGCFYTVEILNHYTFMSL